MGKLHFRRGTRKDLDALNAVEHACFEPPIRFPRSELARMLEHELCWVALERQKLKTRVIGFVMGAAYADEKDKVGYISTLEVLPTHRRRGIAEELLALAEEHLRNEGCRHIALHAAHNNSAAISLYEKRIYRTVDTAPRFYPDGTDALLLLKTL
jgi:ribosomal-protein-alanine N-acetyltransferase